MGDRYVTYGRFSKSNDAAVKLYVASGIEHEIQNLQGDYLEWNRALSMFDGEHSTSTVCEQNKQLDPHEIHDLITALGDANLAFKQESGAQFVSGDEAILEIEDLQAQLLHDHLYKNKFWLAMQQPETVPQNVYYGMAIENFHFLFRESWFDSPVLNFVASTKARLIMNEFYSEEYGHDELIFKALQTLGVSRESIKETIPLPETLALCNALAYWAANDPLFFFTTMGVLEGKDIEVDSFILAMQNSKKISPEFIKPILDHANINIGAEHGVLTRELFREIPVVTLEQLRQMRANTHIFVELYDNFHSAVWNHYSTSRELLRTLSGLTLEGPAHAN